MEFHFQRDECFVSQAVNKIDKSTKQAQTLEFRFNKQSSYIFWFD